MGAQLSASNTRETITYTAKCLRSDLDAMVDNLSDAVTAQTFHSWEVEASKTRLLQSASSSSTDAVIDAVHSGAFRTGLGRPANCPTFKVNAVSAGALRAFADSNFTANNITVVGSGVDHNSLVDVVKRNFGGVASSDSALSASEYHGGFESRVETASGTTSFALAFEGAAIGSADAAVSAVLQNVLVTPKSHKRASGTKSDTVSSAVAACDSSSVEAFNFNYTDSGLIGIVVTSSGGEAGAAITAAVAATQARLSGGFSDDDVNRAKKQAQAAVLNASTDERIAHYAQQLLVTKQPVSPENAAQQIDEVTTAQVKAFAAKVRASKATIATNGDCSTAPYADQLGL